MSEKSIPRRKWGSSDGQKRAVETADFAGVCSGGKFVVFGAGEAYDARARGPNRKFRVDYCDPPEPTDIQRSIGESC